MLLTYHFRVEAVESVVKVCCQDTRTLGLVVCRGTAVTLICPMDGMESIANPFVAQE